MSDRRTEAGRAGPDTKNGKQDKTRDTIRDTARDKCRGCPVDGLG